MKELKEFKKKRRKHLILFLIVILILTAVFGTKIWLYVNFLLGYDTLVNLQADKEYLNLPKDSTDTLTFTSSVVANPFCSVECTSVFQDLSSNNIIQRDAFSISPGLPEKRTFSLSPNKMGTGIDLYRYTITCTSKPTTVCHTEGEQSTRSIVIPVERTLNNEDAAAKQRQQNILLLYSQNLTEQEALYNTLVQLQSQFNIQSNANTSLNAFKTHLKNIQSLWFEQNYQEIETQLTKLNTTATQSAQDIAQLSNTITQKVIEYNKGAEQQKKAEDILKQLANTTLLNSSRINEINQIITQFNNTENINSTFATDIETLAQSVEQELQETMLSMYYNNTLAAEALCIINATCIPHTTIDELATIQINVQTICQQIDEMNIFKSAAVISPSNQAEADNAIQSILRNNPIKNSRNAIILNQLKNQMLTATPITPITKNQDVAQAVSKYIPEKCTIPTIERISVKTLNTPIITIPQVNKSELSSTLPQIEFFEPSRICCLKNNCSACENNPEQYSIIFLHGHAVNQDVSADYSLEGFEKIQNRLEQDGWLSIGAIPLYSQIVPRGTLGLFNTSMTIRGSYYYDIFRSPSSYIIEQSKSESIDTYAVRLKELVDSVVYQTDKPKVRIIAFSMGGLVARRYAQIFGPQNIDKIILIGTPNNGIVDETLNYCSIIGEELECRDMAANSLFMQKLNSMRPTVEIHNIVATGCPMGDGMGDGTVREERAHLDGAQNYVINGTCRSAVYPLHLEIRNIDVYPEVYEIVKGVLG